MATHSSILAWRIPVCQKSLAGCSPWGRKSQTLVSDKAQHSTSSVMLCLPTQTSIHGCSHSGVRRGQEDNRRADPLSHLPPGGHSHSQTSLHPCQTFSPGNVLLFFTAMGRHPLCSTPLKAPGSPGDHGNGTNHQFSTLSCKNPTEPGCCVLLPTLWRIRVLHEQVRCRLQAIPEAPATPQGVLGLATPT